MANFEEIVEALPDEQKSVIKAAFAAANPIAGIDSKEKALEWAEKHPIFKPALDAARTKAIESHSEKFMKEKYPELVKAEIAKVTGPETDPLKIRLNELEARDKQREAEIKREKLTSLAQKIAADEGIPLDDITRFLDEDEDRTAASVKAFAKRWKAFAEAKVEEKLKAQFGNAGAPRNGTTTAPDIVKQYNDLRAAGKIEEANALWIKSQGLMTKG